MERVLYNAFAAAISTDGQRFFYVNPLQRRNDHFEEDDPGRRREWFSCACCPPNIMRLIASLGHYLATTSGDTLHVHHFTGATIAAPLAGGDLELHMTTDYPWSGTVEARVRNAPARSCGIAFRVPGWSPDARFSLNGEPVAASPDAHGYVIVRRHWQPGDVLVSEFDVRPRLTYPDMRIDAVRGTVAIERGPLVYCFEQADQADGLDVEDLAILPGALRDLQDALPGVGRTVLIEASAVTLPARPGRSPYTPTPNPQIPNDSATADHVTAIAVPYLHWDNRDGRAMRVWMRRSST
jgi:uncharacterized protein